MGKYVKIISLKEHKIEYRVKIKKQGIVVPFSLAFIAITLLCFSFGGNIMDEIGNNVAYVFNPVNSLYSDNSQLIFTNGTLVEKGSLDFVVPIKSDNVESSGSQIEFTCVNSIMVMSPEGGVVREVGLTLDGIKYIKIQHSADVESVIENVDIVGVVEGDVVKRGQDVAIAQLGEVIRLKVFENGVQVGNLKVNQSKVIWKD